ncbi:MAG: hypothetical protein BWX74_00706 [Tenericutes bacterium ADurb.Bin087]|nr:MAG: hypothetical protein BWX74_00706 [Tenericutes bacterium ADurb.Bin087]
MRNNKIIRRALILIVPIFVLTSCVTLGDVLASSQSGATSTTTSNSGQTSETPGGNPYPLDGTYGTNTYEHPISANPDRLDNYYLVEDISLNNQLVPNYEVSNTMGLAHLDSIANQKMMVVPLRFTDTPASYGSDATIQGAINRAFFGATSDTGWESVASYYYKSSYGKLNLTGEIMPIFDLGYSTSDLLAKPVDGHQYWDKSHHVLEQVYNTYYASKLKEYDVNSDGYVDSVFFVYLAPVDHESDESVFWAFQYFWNHYPDTNKPPFSAYAWASYEFMVEAPGYTYLKPSAHTYIHESGHILSFDDYYDYDGTIAPAGAIDMMDHNIIDHNMFSKFVANWSTPYVPVGNSDITIGPAATTGDFVIINDGWNGHQYDEYILIEYYTPTGLNEHDSLSVSGYGGVKGYSVPGVRIWHVDARLLMISTDYRATKRWTDVMVPYNTGSYMDFATSNTPSYNLAHSSLRKLHLLDGRGRAQTWGNNLVRADNSALFQTGTIIASDDWQRYLLKRSTFNDGSEIGYSIEIGAMNNDGVTIKIRKA